MTRHQKLFRCGKWMTLLAIAVVCLLTPSLAHAQSSNCAAGAVWYYADDGDQGTDIEQTVCIYYDGESGVDTSVETENDSYADWQDPGSLWIFGVGSEAQVWGSNSDLYSDFLLDTGMWYDEPSDTGGAPLTIGGWPQWGYAMYYLQGIYAVCGQVPEEFDDSYCSWNSPYTGGPNPGLNVNLQVASYPDIPAPTINLSTSGTPATYGQPVTFTATVSNGPNTGYVSIYDGSTYIGYASLTNATGTFSTYSTLLAIGNNSITAVWSADPDYSVTSNTVVQQMKMMPTVGVSCSPGTANYGSSSTCTATVSGYGATGNVSFSNYGIVWANSTLSSGSASASSPTVLYPGTFTIVANYSGDSYNLATSASTTLAVQTDSLMGNVYSYNANSYDTNGNVLAYTDSVMGAWSFSYDQLNRLTTAANGTMPAGSNWAANFCWAYDAFGNRLAQSTSNAAFSTSDGGCSTSGTLYQNTIASYNAQNQVTSTNAPGFTLAPPSYDGAGDVSNDGNNQYLYDAEGRLCAVNSSGGMTGYLYDAAGNRVAKGSISTMSCDITTNGFTAEAGYVVGPSGEQMTEVDGSNNWKHTNVYAGGKQIGTYDSAGLHFYLDDPLGTRRAQTNSSGTLEATYQSLPFGDDLVSTGSDDPTENHFTGKERDAESGNDYMFARYYNSATGRFLSPDWDAKGSDPVPYAKLDDPQSLNLYAYVRNNPTGLTDNDGHAITCATGMNNRQVCVDTVQAMLADPATHDELAGYDGSDNPDLTIQGGDLSSHDSSTVKPDGTRGASITQGATVPDIQTSTFSSTDSNGVTTTSPPKTRLISTTITIDNRTSANDMPKVMVHEGVHAENALQNPAKYQKDAADENKTFPNCHDCRPQEQRANGAENASGSRINDAVKKIGKDRKKDKKEEK